MTNNSISRQAHLILELRTHGSCPGVPVGNGYTTPYTRQIVLRKPDEPLHVSDVLRFTVQQPVQLAQFSAEPLTGAMTHALRWESAKISDLLQHALDKAQWGIAFSSTQLNEPHQLACAGEWAILADIDCGAFLPKLYRIQFRLLLAVPLAD